MTQLPDSTVMSEDDPIPPPPAFTPTEDQAAALTQMAEWLPTHRATSRPFFLLMGYAGTGKSFCITELAKNGPFRPEQICFTAPTNKAVKVLRNYLDGVGLGECQTKTIYSLLGLSLQANGEVKEITKPDEPVDLSRYKAIVVDEGSMINRFLMDAINEAYLDWGVPFIFMGDPAQLPPVGEIMSPIFKIENGVTLTKVLRYGNAILDLATSIREVVDHPFPTIKITTNPPVFRLGRIDFEQKLLEHLPELRSGDAKAISWRNVTVDRYNQLVRSAIFGRQESRLNPWLPTDKIVATAHLKDLDDETFMRTDEEAVVGDCVVKSHPWHPDIECYDILATIEGGKRHTLFVPTSAGALTLNHRLNDLSREAKNGKRYKWREFWKLKETFHEIKHSYAITTHRSQGSSYLRTFVDLEDIMLNRNRAEAFRSLYVACTRAREEIFIS